MKKISVTSYGTVHHHAMCEGCGWSDEINIEERNRSQQLRNRVYKHIRKTGHSVQVEAGTAIRYDLKDL